MIAITTSTSIKVKPRPARLASFLFTGRLRW
jgi:hypothetical protein